MFIINHRKIFVGISVFIVLVALGIIAVFGLKAGIDFKGGALTQVAYTGERPSVEEIQKDIAPLQLGNALVQPTGTDGYSIKTRDLSETDRVALMAALNSGDHQVNLKNFTSIGPSVGKELTRKAIISIVLVALFIILFITYAFRGVSRPISSWKYGLIAVVTLLHDIIIPTGMFALLGHFRGAEIDTLFVVALLTILGLSVSDTIVVFDRIRENLRVGHYKTFAETVGHSVSETFARSLITSLTVIVVLLSLFLFGPVSTKNFALVLVVGMFFGTYSSIFVASPLLVFAEEWQEKRAARNSRNRNKR